MYDYKGREWIVREERSTNHGFSIYLGRPFDSPRGYKTVILTKELAEYLLAARQLRPKDIDLPIGKTPLKVLRKELGVSWFKEREAWWRDKEAELQTLTLEQFAAKYSVSPAAASMRLDSMKIKKPRHTGRPLPEELSEEIKEKIGSTSDVKLAKTLNVGVSSVRRRKTKKDEKVKEGVS